MANINTSDFKKGIKVLVDGEPYDMVGLEFVKPGKGQALYRTRLKNLIKGTYLDKTYKSGDGLEEADVRKTDGVYSYRDANGYVFMDNETFEQHSLPLETCVESLRYIKEGSLCQLLYWNDRLIDFTPPAHVTLEITYTEPAVRGNTSSNVTKAATVETGAEIQVPAFVASGDKSIQIVDSYSYRLRGRIPIRENLYGPLRASLPTAAELSADPTLVVKLFGLTKEGLVVIDVRRGDIDNVPRK